MLNLGRVGRLTLGVAVLGLGSFAGIGCGDGRAVVMTGSGGQTASGGAGGGAGGQAGAGGNSGGGGTVATPGLQYNGTISFFRVAR
jgi:hypothetical protein